MFVLEIKEFDQEKMSQRIQAKRKEKGLTAAQVAAYLEVSANQVSRIERGTAQCNAKQLYILQQVLECSADYLLDGEERVILNSSQQMQLQEIQEDMKTLQVDVEEFLKTTKLTSPQKTSKKRK